MMELSDLCSSASPDLPSLSHSKSRILHLFPMGMFYTTFVLKLPFASSPPPFFVIFLLRLFVTYNSASKSLKMMVGDLDVLNHQL